MVIYYIKKRRKPFIRRQPYCLRGKEVGRMWGRELGEERLGEELHLNRKQDVECVIKMHLLKIS